MRHRFNKAAFYFGRVKYGYVRPVTTVIDPVSGLPVPAPKAAPQPGAGAKRQWQRLYAKIEAHPEISHVETRQTRRAAQRRGVHA